LNKKFLLISTGVLVMMAGIALYGYAFFSGWGVIPPGYEGQGTSWFKYRNVKRDQRRYAKSVEELCKFYSARGYTVNKNMVGATIVITYAEIFGLTISRNIDIQNKGDSPPQTNLMFISDVRRNRRLSNPL
jgi:hypothetical protein